jgi:AbrB family looped-hinge helix DNA binding protein
MTVTLKPKTEIIVPPSIRRKAGLKPGDRLAFKVSGRTITIVPQQVAVVDEYSAAERRAINRGIAASEKDYREGRSYGPFNTHEEFLASLHAEAAKLRGKKKNVPQR